MNPGVKKSPRLLGAKYSFEKRHYWTNHLAVNQPIQFVTEAYSESDVRQRDSRDGINQQMLFDEKC